MKFLLISLFLCSLASARTLEELKADWVKALETRDHDLLWSLTHYEGYSEAELNEAKINHKKYFDRKYEYAIKSDLGDLKVIDVERSDINLHYPKPYSVRLGVRHDFVSKPLGCWKIWSRYSKDKETNKQGSLNVYGVVNGSHCFLSQKETEIDWQGPKDTRLFLKMKLHSDSDTKATLQITWNASGVTLTKKSLITNKHSATKSISIYGQYIEKIALLETEPYDSIDVKIMDNKENGKDYKMIFEQSFKEGEKVLYQRPE